MRYLRQIGLLGFISFSITAAAFAADVPEHFINANPPAADAPAPGDYAMPDVQASRIAYETEKQSLLSDDMYNNSNTLVTTGGEISFNAMKNQSTQIKGYVRNYAGALTLQDGKPAALAMLLDINSIDTAVPGRNNRILDLFFKSQNPTLGTARIILDKFTLGETSVEALSDGQIHSVNASGTLLLNGVEKPLSATFNVQKLARAWKVSTTEPITLLISDYGFEERIPAFLAACGHKALGNKVTVETSLYLQ